jgi:hypothetical protein
MSTTLYQRTLAELRPGDVLVSQGGHRWTILAIRPGSGPLPAFTLLDQDDGRKIEYDNNVRREGMYLVEVRG